MRALVIDHEAGIDIVPVLERSGVICEYSDVDGDRFAAAEPNDYDIFILSPDILKEIVRRANEYTTPEISVGKLRIDTKKRTVMAGDNLVHLSRNEYRLVEVLAMNARTVVPMKAVLNHIYPDGKYPGSRVIDVFLCYIRQKLSDATDGEHYIETKRGRGYMMIDRSNEEAEG
jgi:DNA-binding winged helix-turn-helix (wHTH) protein